MLTFTKKYWKTLLFFVVIGLFGGFFTGLYMLDTYPAEIRQQILDQGINDILLGIVTAVQTAGYALILGFIGIWIAKEIGLWKDERSITFKPLRIAIVVSIFAGAALILPDFLFFGQYSEAIMNSYAVKPTIPYLLATITYGAVVEEVMLRLFLMSLISWILHKLLGKKQEKPTTLILIVSNIITSLVFAALHLPATAILLGLTPMIVFRCFLFNGALGLLFGRLYRKYGLRYAMIAHGGCHIVSKLIWILFI